MQTNLRGGSHVCRILLQLCYVLTVQHDSIQDYSAQSEQDTQKQEEKW